MRKTSSVFLLFIVIIIMVCLLIINGKSTETNSDTEQDTEVTEEAAETTIEASDYNSQRGQNNSTTSDEITSENITDETDDTLGETDFSTETEEEHKSQKMIAIDPGCVGCDFDESIQEYLGPGSSETDSAYTNGGTGTITGIKEYDVNLAVSNYLNEILKNRGYSTIMLRTDNESLATGKERAEAAYAAGADICVRIFCRKQQEDSIRGAMVYIPSKDSPFISGFYNQSNALGNAILYQYCLATNFENSGIKYTDEVKGINWSKIPVAQILLGCINDPSDEIKLADKDMWKQMAIGIANGIDSYYTTNPQ